MSKNHIIRQLLASLLLVLFTFSATPRKFLHDWFANHKDIPGKFTQDSHTRVQQTTYNCQTQDQVVESPFISGPTPILLQAPLTACIRYAESEIRIQTRFFVFLSLRGPPALA
ncbi:MAG: hypothetical protein JST68_08515 [Bacteroidetes bacterium]|nr:hypothetical protein [Bacteroidota bacterium]